MQHSHSIGSDDDERRRRHGTTTIRYKKEEQHSPYRPTAVVQSHRANDRPESKSLYIWMTSTVRTSVSSVVVLGAVVVVVVQCWITKLLDKGK